MCDGGYVGGLAGAVREITKKQRDILLQNNGVGVIQGSSGRFATYRKLQRNALKNCRIPISIYRHRSPSSVTV
jgi:hypothetical protein